MNGKNLLVQEGAKVTKCPVLHCRVAMMNTVSTQRTLGCTNSISDRVRETEQELACPRMH